MHVIVAAFHIALTRTCVCNLHPEHPILEEQTRAGLLALIERERMGYTLKRVQC